MGRSGHVLKIMFMTCFVNNFMYKIVLEHVYWSYALMGAFDIFMCIVAFIWTCLHIIYVWYS